MVDLRVQSEALNQHLNRYFYVDERLLVWRVCESAWAPPCARKDQTKPTHDKCQQASELTVTRLRWCNLAKMMPAFKVNIWLHSIKANSSTTTRTIKWEKVNDAANVVQPTTLYL